MPAPDMRDTIARLMKHTEAGEEAYLGTCFAFGRPDLFLTAAHCVGQHRGPSLRVRGHFGGVAQDKEVEWVAVHDTADLAALQVRTAGWGTIAEPRPIEGVKSDIKYGEPFNAYGFTVEAVPEATSGEAGRLFKGHIQRFFRYESPVFEEYRYHAAELSIICPRGLSGGPVFTTKGEFELIAVATEDFDSTNIVDEVVEIEESGTRFREVLRKVIRYGIGVHAGWYSDWIEARV